MQRVSGIARSTVYNLLGSLVERSLVSVAYTAGTTLYSIANPSSFLDLIEKEKEDVLRREKTVKQLVDLLSPALTEPGTGIPKIRFFSGKQNIERMLSDNFILWRKLIAQDDYTWWGYQDDAFVGQYRRFLEHLWKTTAPEEKVRLFSNESKLERGLKGKISADRIIRPIPKQYHFSSTIWVLANYVIMITTRHKPHYAFQLDDVIFASNLKTVFQLLWQLTGNKEK